jgi:hypothetical protein
MELSEIIEGERNIGMIPAEGTLGERQKPLPHRNRVRKATSICEAS